MLNRKCRAGKIVSFILMTILLFCSGCDTGQRTDFIAEQLRCEYRVNPSGIDTVQPRLSWILNSSRRGQKQTAYQVLVASSQELLDADKADLWDSGKVISDRSVHIAYNGTSLQSRMRYYWKVMIWDRNGVAGNWSTAAMWAMGQLSPDDWHGQWIGAMENTIPPSTVSGYHALEAGSAYVTKWVQVDLGSTQAIDDIRLHPAIPSGFPHAPGFGFPLRFRIDVSDDPDFAAFTTIADHTDQDYPNPGDNVVIFDAGSLANRYARIRATKLWDRQTGGLPFCFALGEMEVFSSGANAALNSPVTAKDSVEGGIWGKVYLTDGLNLAGNGQEDDTINHAILLRKEFQLTAPLVRATAYICGLGYYELYINGVKVGNHVLDPGFTDFAKRILYVTYDVTSLIAQGNNCLGTILGGGWYRLATPDLFSFEVAPWTAPPKLLLEIDLEFADGTHQSIVSDTTWKWSTGPITFNCVRGGETYDAMQEKQGWNLTGYDDSNWQEPLAVSAPTGELLSQQHPPIRVTKSITPVNLAEPQPGIYVFDLGVNIAGWARLETSGTSGQEITLHFNEVLNPDGTVNTGHNSSHTHGRFQTGVFILKGQGSEVYEPRFTYHGFRYVQVEGLTQPPALESLTGRWVTTDPEPAGQFSCSNQIINQIQEITLRTQLNNLHGIPTDCPQREKMGWMNDGCVTMEEAIYNFDMATFYTKWFHDMIDTQDDNGFVADFVPTSGWGKSNPDGSPGAMADPWWGGAIVLTPWKLYNYYADLRVLEDGYDAMKAYVEYLTAHSNNHLVEWGLGDWLEGSAGGGGGRVPVVQTSTLAYYYYADIISKTASLLGYPADAAAYANLAASIRTAFNDKFFDPETGLYAADSQTAQAIPLYLSVAPEDKRDLIIDQLVTNIEQTRQGHISTGIVGALYLMHALMDSNRDDLAYTITTQQSYPGWYYMIANGATSIWEAWDGSSSLNHPTFGCAGMWYYQGLAGIRPDPSAPGFKKIIIKPAIVGDLTEVKASFNSVHGQIVSNWHIDGGSLYMNITIPVNTTATVYIPANDPSEVTESGMPTSQANGITFVRMENAMAVFDVGSGRYEFVSVLPN